MRRFLLNIYFKFLYNLLKYLKIYFIVYKITIIFFTFNLVKKKKTLMDMLIFIF